MAEGATEGRGGRRGRKERVGPCGGFIIGARSLVRRAGGVPPRVRQSPGAWRYLRRRCTRGRATPRLPRREHHHQTRSHLVTLIAMGMLSSSLVPLVPAGGAPAMELTCPRAEYHVSQPSQDGCVNPNITSVGLSLTEGTLASYFQWLDQPTGGSGFPPLKYLPRCPPKKGRGTVE